MLDDYTDSSEDRSTALPIVVFAWLTIVAIASFVAIIMLGRDNLTDGRLLVGAALAGAVGAAVQSAHSLTGFIGHRRFERQWTIFYMLKPLVGSMLAIIVFLLLRSLFVGPVPASALNYNGILAMSLIAGFASGNLVPGFISVTEARLTRSPSTGQLERYHGFLVYRMKADSEQDVLECWLQDRPNDELASVEINTGEGLPARRVTFQITVYADAGEVSPSSGELVGGTEVTEASKLEFDFTGSGDDGAVPGAFLEVTQRGRTVAIVPIGTARDSGGILA